MSLWRRTFKFTLRPKQKNRGVVVIDLISLHQVLCKPRHSQAIISQLRSFFLES